MNNLQEDGDIPIVIDLSNDNKLDESWLRMLGFGIKSVLSAMFGGSSVPVNVKGNRHDIEAFTKTIGKEKRYMDSIRKFGLDNPRTFQNKSALDKATKEFTRKTGVKWPFK